MKNSIKSAFACGLGAVLVGACATAQETSPEPAAGTPLMAHYSFSTNDAQGVIGSFDAVMDQCKEGIPAEVSVYEELFNGSSQETHTVIFTYPNAAAMMQTGATFATCPAAVAFGYSVGGLAVPGAEFLGEPILGDGDPGADNAFMVFQMGVSDEASYAAAYADFMQAGREGGAVSGSYGLVRSLAGGDGKLTHYAFVGAADLDTLLSNMRDLSPENNEARREFMSAVADIRKLRSSDLVVRVKDYN